MMGGGDPQHKAVKIGEGWREVNAVNDVSVNEWIDARLPTDGGRETDAYMRTSVLHDHPTAGRRATWDRLPRRTDNRRRATRSIRSKTVLGEVTVVGYAVEEEQDDDDDDGADEGERRSSRKK